MWRAWLTVGRDVICLALGIWGVIHEELSPHPDVYRMIFFGTLMVTPAAITTWWLGRNTNGSSSPSPPLEPPPSPSLPSSPSRGA